MFYFYIFLTSLFATTISSMSGGGSSVIAIPIFLSLGIPFPMASAMQQVNSTFWVIPSAYNYLKGKKIYWSLIFIYSLLGLFGTYFGVLVITQYKKETLETIIGTIILFLTIFLFLNKNFGTTEKKNFSKFKNFLIYLFAIPMGFYEGLFGSGNGLFFFIISAFCKGFDFIDALGHYYAISFLWVLFAAIILIEKGFFSLFLMLPAVLGSLLGGYFGSKFAKFKGNRFIKYAFIIVGTILGIKLILHL